MGSDCTSSCQSYCSVLRAISEEDRADEVDLKEDELPSVKTFGVTWDAVDVFTFTSTALETLG